GEVCVSLRTAIIPAGAFATPLYRKSKRQVLDGVDPLARLRSLGNQFQILDVLPDGAVELMAENKAAKGATFTLPVLGHRFETNVLRKHDSAEFPGVLQ